MISACHAWCAATDFSFILESDRNMVLAELGGRIAQAMRSMTSKTVIDEEAVDNMLKEISSVRIRCDRREQVLYLLVRRCSLQM